MGLFKKARSGDGMVHVRGAGPIDTKADLDGWVQRMGQSMAVGQQFRKLLGY
ncbi:hypothetical protein [Mycobacterium sp. 1164985.4]|uniref:hypothetical protein n=1 Tax=Mycobacterium sp. 1164985.4 TaxID=1834069 RepID=UPI0012EAE5AD|nr:hypothetical protein [Mycobacterium sp. 1164985.4]